MSTLFLNVIQGASAVAGIAGALNEGKAVQSAEEYNAAVAENQAEVERLEGIEQARRLRIENKEILGSQVARRAASGVSIGTGSPLLVQAETAGRLELEVFENNRARSARAEQLQSEAAMARFRGKQARSASKYKAGEALFRGVGAIASTRI